MGLGLTFLVLALGQPPGDGAAPESPPAATAPAQPLDAILVPPPAESKPADDLDLFRFRWNNGLHGSTADDKYKFHIGGTLHIDSAGFVTPDAVQNNLNAPFEDGVTLRRFRIATDGMILGWLGFALHADLARSSDFRVATSDPDPTVFITDAWVEINDLPYLNSVRIGHQTEALSFVAATSSRFQTFMERGFVHDAINDEFIYGTGISARRSWFDERLTAWAGIFKPGSRTGGFAIGDGSSGIDARLHGFPVYDIDDKDWWYVGAGGSIRNVSDDTGSLSIRPLIRAGTRNQIPNLIDTGTIATASTTPVLTAGSYAAHGPLTIGGEYSCTWVSDAFANALPDDMGRLPPGARPLGDLFLRGFYAEALCFLTPGDHHPVNRVAGGLDRVIPVSNFSPGRGQGIGAWEVGVRYDRFDGNSGDLQAGALDAMTVALNWYLTPNLKVMSNYVYTSLHSGTPGASGAIHAFGIRTAFDF